MVFSTKPVTEQHNLVNVQEAFNLWDMLCAKYQQGQQIQILENFVHDKDFKIILGKIKSDYFKQSNKLEKLLTQFGIKGMEAPSKGINTSVNTEVVDDELIASWIFVMVQEEIEMDLRAVRTSTTNDYIRHAFIAFTKEAVSRVDTLIKFLKLKGWIMAPPIYPNIPEDTPEIIDCGEAFHLWDHLVFRYDNISQTQKYYTTAHDGDLKIMLKTGLQDVLFKQAQKLEKKALYFGIPLPKCPSNVMPVIQDTETIEDDYIYRMINNGIQGAAILHANAIKQSVTNDSVRRLFIELIFEEINTSNSMIEYGKLKGWLHETPHYKLKK